MIRKNNFLEESFSNNNSKQSKGNNNDNVLTDPNRSKSHSSKKRNRPPEVNNESHLKLFKNSSNSDLEFSKKEGQGHKKEDKSKEIEKARPVYRILEPYRTLGLITSDTKFAYYKRSNARFILLSNSNSFLLYNLEKLKLERISPPLPSKINAVAMINNIVYTATENTIISWNKIHIVKSLLLNIVKRIYWTQTSDFTTSCF